MANNPSTTLPIITAMQSRWKFINDLTDGWEGIVEKNKKVYLPKEPDETDPSYTARSAQATYYDFFNPTVNGLKGLIFQKPVVVNDDVPSSISDLLSDLDTLGNNLDTVIKTYTDTGIRKGLAYAYIDMQTKLEESVSQQEESQLGIRPYVILIQPEYVLNYKYAVVDGNTILTQITFQETITVDKDRFEMEEEVQYRVLTIGGWEVYNKDFTLVDSGATGLNEIPVVALNLDDSSVFLQAKPPFYTLGKMNIRHYQNTTDTAWASHMANVPMLKILGIPKEELGKITITANKAIVSERSAQDVSIDWLDFKGDNIATNMSIAKDYEGQIALMGLSVISEGEMQQTATETVIQTKQKQSILNSWVTDLEDAVAKIFYFMGQYLNLGNDTGTVEIDADILSNMLTAEEMAKYSDMVAKGQMSVETMWSILKSNKKLPKDFDGEVEKEKIETEGLLGGEPRTTTN